MQRRTDGTSLDDEALAKIYAKAYEQALASHDFNPDMLARVAGSPLNEETRYVYTRADAPGVAILNVTGPIFRRANLMTAMSGATSTGRMALEFHMAMQDSKISRILIDGDGPGGEAFGIGEFADMVFDARQAGLKEIQGYCGGCGASAHYYILAATERLTISKSAMVGSIGTVIKAQKPRKDDDTIEFVSAQSPNKRPKITTDAGKAEIQQIVDDMAQVFIEDVARYRGVSAETVMEEYGKGGVRIGARAVECGLADGIGTFESTLRALAPKTQIQGTGDAGTVGEEASSTPGNEGPSIMSTDEANGILREYAARDFEALETDERNLYVMALEALVNAPDSGPLVAAVTSGRLNPFLGGALRGRIQLFIKAHNGQGEEAMGLLDKWRTDKKNDVGAKTTTTGAAQGNAAQKGLFAALETLTTQEAFEARVTELFEQYGPEATLFATNTVLAGHIYPAQLDSCALELIDAMTDDSLLPRQVQYLADGKELKGTRADAVKARYQALPKHTLAEESVEAVKKGEKEAVVLADAKEDAGKTLTVTAERKKELLQRSGQGQAALAAQANQNGARS